MGDEKMKWPEKDEGFNVETMVRYLDKISLPTDKLHTLEVLANDPLSALRQAKSN